MTEQSLVSYYSLCVNGSKTLTGGDHERQLFRSETRKTIFGYVAGLEKRDRQEWVVLTL